MPKDIFGLLKGKESTFTCLENFGCVGTAEVKFHAKTIEDRLQLPIPVRKCLLDRDCDEIPLYQNQTGYFNDLETLEWFWDLPKESSEDDPGKKTPNSHCSKPFVEGLSGDGRGDVSVSVLPTSASALAVPPIDDSSTEDFFVCESHKTPSKRHATSEQECPNAPKKGES